ncbi:hypothetical protein ACQJBY_000586 [Aegilops geniculata]
MEDSITFYQVSIQVTLCAKKVIHLIPNLLNIWFYCVLIVCSSWLYIYFHLKYLSFYSYRIFVGSSVSVDTSRVYAFSSMLLKATVMMATSSRSKRTIIELQLSSPVG